MRKRLGLERSRSLRPATLLADLVSVAPLASAAIVQRIRSLPEQARRWGRRGAGLGVVRLAIVSLLAALNAWLAQSEFLPLQRVGRPLEYIIVSVSLARFLADWGISAGLLLAWHAAVVPPAAPGSLTRRLVLTRENTRYLNPLFWLALSLAPLLTLLQPLAGRLSAWSYFLFDLRWWWWPLVGLAAARASWPTDRWRLKVRLDRLPVPWSSLVIAAAAGAVVWVSTPSIRVKAFLVGDEPKYVRYCEAFYQGLGFDISKLSTLPNLPKGYRTRLLDNVRNLVAAVPEEAANLANDAVEFVRGRRAFNRAKYLGGWFVGGKRPGSIYQVHQPGVGIVLFPAYFLDRLRPGWSFDGKFPVKLPALSTGLLVLFMLYAVALHRLLLDYTGDLRLASVCTLLGVLSMPVSAHAFQVYPEIPAGICFVSVVYYLLSDRPRPIWKACLYGALAAYPIWLHVRFGLAVAILGGWALLGWRRDRRAVVAFASAFGAVFVSFCLYAYRLTGSLLPTAVYDTRGGVISVRDVVAHLSPALLDVTWGVLPHSPVYLLALPGLWLAWRRRRSATLLVCLLFAAVAASAGHDFSAGGTTPGRYFAASMPLLMLFVADAAARFRRSRAFSAALIVLGLISVETAVTYNLHDYVGEAATLAVSGFSGWRPNALFPELSRAGLAMAPANVAIWWAWIVLLVGLGVLGFLASRRPETRPEPDGADGSTPWRPRTSRGTVAAFVFVLAAAGTTISASRGDWVRPEYIVSPSNVGQRVLSFHLARGGRCALCAASGLGLVDPVALLGASATELRLELPPGIVAGQPVELKATALAGENVPAWGMLRIDFGDGAFDQVPHLFGESRVSHVFQEAGTYQIRAWFTTRTPKLVTSELTVDVASAGPDSPIQREK